MPEKDEVSSSGVYLACAICFAAVVGQEFTTGRSIDTWNWLWLGLYGLSVLVLSGAVVNFNPRRWLS